MRRSRSAMSAAAADLAAASAEAEAASARARAASASASFCAAADSAVAWADSTEDFAPSSCAFRPAMRASLRADSAWAAERVSARSDAAFAWAFMRSEAAFERTSASSACAASRTRASAAATALPWFFSTSRTRSSMSRSNSASRTCLTMEAYSDSSTVKAFPQWGHLIWAMTPLSCVLLPSRVHVGWDNNSLAAPLGGELDKNAPVAASLGQSKGRRTMSLRAFVPLAQRLRSPSPGAGHRAASPQPAPRRERQAPLYRHAGRAHRRDLAQAGCGDEQPKPAQKRIDSRFCACFGC